MGDEERLRRVREFEDKIMNVVRSIKSFDLHSIECVRLMYYCLLSRSPSLVEMARKHLSLIDYEKISNNPEVLDILKKCRSQIDSIG